MTPRKKIQYCSYHTDVAATGTCFECAKPICYNCTMELFGQKFCSHRCASLYLGANVFKGLSILIGGCLRGIGRLLQTLAATPPRAVVSFLLASGLAVSLFFIWKLDSQVQQLKTSQPELESTAASDIPETIEPPRLTAPPGGTVTSNKITVIGEAEPNRIVSLTVNGALKEVLLPKEGRFTFNDILLKRGDNRLEVRAISPDGMVSTLETMMINYADPSFSVLMRDVRRGALDRSELALTFDGGAESNAAPAILDALKENQVRATFFLTGTFIRRFPELVRRIANEGHEVGNHTWSHPRLTTFAETRRQETHPEMNETRLHDELKRTAALFKRITGKEMQHYWRAPYGEYNRDILAWAAGAGYQHIGWTGGRGWMNNGDTMDWVADTTSSIYHTADEIVEKVVNFGYEQQHGANGAVMLMHLGTNRLTEQVHLKMDEIISGLLKRGVTPVTVSELLR